MKLSLRAGLARRRGGGAGCPARGRGRSAGAAVTPGAPHRRRLPRSPASRCPGLANAHSHAFQRALRGRTHAGAGSFWTWREQMYELARALDPDSCFALSRAAFGEMALAGITCVGEFHYLHHAPDGTPYDDPNAMGRAVLAAARAAGLRCTLLDACYLHGGIERFRDRDADAWAERVDLLAERGPARVGAAIHSVRAVDPDAARVVAEWAAGKPLHAHVSEQPKENEDTLAAHGTHADRAARRRRRARRELHRDPRHAPDRGGRGAARRLHGLPLPDDRARPRRRHRARRGASPTRARALATGSDSHAVIDPFEEARAIELDERLATGIRGAHRAPDLLDGGHGRRLRRARLARGRPARARRARRPHHALARLRAPGGHRARARGRERGVRRDRRRRPRRDGRRRLDRPRRPPHRVRRRRPRWTRRWCEPRRRQHRAARHQRRVPRRGPARARPRRRAGDRGRPSSRPSSARARRPTSGSTRRGGA